MSRKQRVRYHLDSKGIKKLSHDEIKAVLRAADDLIMSGGRTLLAKVLKGSRAKDVLALGLNQSPVYGYYRGLSEEDILARIDWAILPSNTAVVYLCSYSRRSAGTSRRRPTLMNCSAASTI